jgi:hypothetical protein
MISEHQTLSTRSSQQGPLPAELVKVSGWVGDSPRVTLTVLRRWERSQHPTLTSWVCTTTNTPASKLAGGGLVTLARAVQARGQLLSVHVAICFTPI